MRLASAEDFEAGGNLYSAGYRRYPFFTDRAASIRGRYANTSIKILVAGCGYGYLLDELTALGYTDVWGCDASAYAITKAQEVLPPALAARVIQADITVRSQVNALRSAAGLSGNQRFAAVITEDVLPVLTDAEVQAALTELRRATQAMLHIITPDSEGADRTLGLNWKTTPEWHALIGVTSEWILDVHTGLVTDGNGVER